VYQLRRFDSNSCAFQKEKCPSACLSLLMPCVTPPSPLDPVMRAPYHKTFRLRRRGATRFATVWERRNKEEYSALRRQKAQKGAKQG